MLIEYIWIEDYGIIKGQGFNFNPNAEYAFDPNTTPRSLSRTEKPRVPENFFHTGEEKRKGTVSRVSALVGANGAGQTSVMAFLTAFLTNNRKDTCRGILVTTEGTFVYLSEKDLTLDFTGDWPEATEKFKEIRNGTGDILSEHIKDTGLFTFQGELNFDHFAWRPVAPPSDERDRKHWDLSDSFEMAEYLRSQDGGVYDGSDPILSYRSKQAVEFIRLILEESRREEPIIPFPTDHLKVEVRFNDDIEEFFRTYYEDLLQFFKNKLESAIKDCKSKVERFDLYRHHYILLHQLREKLLKMGFDLLKIEDTINTIKINFLEKNQYLKEIRDYLEKRPVLPELHVLHVLPELLSDSLKNNPELKKNMYVFIDSILSKHQNTINDELFSYVELFEFLSYIGYKSPYLFKFHFPGLSTGERQFLKIFSRFDRALNRASSRPEFETFIILLDEFEINFHPEWQRKFLKTWISFLERIPEDGDIRFQIILATHSPFVVSDLPMPCITFLSREEGQSESKVDTLEKHSATLGANIFELFQDSFFMKNVLMGDWAKAKIDELFKELIPKEKSTPETPENLENLKKIIDLVGDPLIQTKLRELYYRKTGTLPLRSQLLAQRDYIDKKLKEMDNDQNSI